jgi:hypothetical protein
MNSQNQNEEKEVIREVRVKRSIFFEVQNFKH